MPTYEYICEECEYQFEEFQKITDEPLITCPECGGKIRRIITGGSGFILKGSGFYKTDYAGDTRRIPNTSGPPEHDDPEPDWME